MEKINHIQKDLSSWSKCLTKIKSALTMPPVLTGLFIGENPINTFAP